MKYLILTSIFKPTKAIKKFMSFSKEYRVLVVGDKKTPLDWNLVGVDYISPETQKNLNFKLIKQLPWNNYARKNIGYLLAIKKGAEIIAESDDDNIAYNNWGTHIPKEKFLVKDKGFINIYKFFTSEKIWPRGFPLDEILIKQTFKIEKLNEKKFDKYFKTVGIIQYLADVDPDVDAIYRLILRKEINFKKTACLILEKNLYTPFNSQNTFFLKRELFPLLYLPSYVSIRATDIYRGYIAQYIAWSLGYRLMVGPPTVYQERNYHNFLKDFELEIPVYLNTKKLVEVLKDIKFKNEDIFKRIYLVYEELVKAGIFINEELKLIKNWVEDIKNF